MPPWKPESKWKGQDVFVIGGGDSLRNFDWTFFKNELTIGCNTAFRLGKDVCKICFFGDAKWFKKFKRDLNQYEVTGGVIFTSAPQLYKTRLSWLWTMGREARGLHTDALGWNDNTGASAVNLALILGAKTVYLLGFDMKLSKEGKSNWHDHLIAKPSESVYPKFVTGFQFVKKDLPKVFPGRQIINITDDSCLDCFPKISVKDFFAKRKEQV